VDLDNLSLAERVAWSKDYALYLHGEVGEFLRELPSWKVHRGQKDTTIIRSNMLEEWIDIFKYWLCLGQVWGFTPEEFLAEFERKSMVVEQRFKQERLLDLVSPDAKVVGVDIDGVLADYPRSFVEFVNSKLGTCYRVEDVRGYDVYSQLGLSPEIGQQLKDEYRQTGQKRYIPLCEGAKDFLQWLKSCGYAVVLLTSRPYEQYKRILPDTMEWLRDNDLPYDAILFAQDKMERLLKVFGTKRIEFFVDDVAKYANDIARLGVPCYLISRPYNLDATLHPGVCRVASLPEVIVTSEDLRDPDFVTFAGGSLMNTEYDGRR
jgi:uncharacterized HAD superfamily protein